MMGPITKSFLFLFLILMINADVDFNVQIPCQKYQKNTIPTLCTEIQTFEDRTKEYSILNAIGTLKLKHQSFPMINDFWPCLVEFDEPLYPIPLGASVWFFLCLGIVFCYYITKLIKRCFASTKDRLMLRPATAKLPFIPLYWLQQTPREVALKREVRSTWAWLAKKYVFSTNDPLLGGIDDVLTKTTWDDFQVPKDTTSLVNAILTLNDLYIEVTSKDGKKRISIVKSKHKVVVDKEKSKLKSEVEKKEKLKTKEPETAKEKKVSAEEETKKKEEVGAVARKSLNDISALKSQSSKKVAPLPRPNTAIPLIGVKPSESSKIPLQKALPIKLPPKEEKASSTKSTTVALVTPSNQKEKHQKSHHKKHLSTPKEEKKHEVKKKHEKVPEKEVKKQDTKKKPEKASVKEEKKQEIKMKPEIALEKVEIKHELKKKHEKVPEKEEKKHELKKKPEKVSHKEEKKPEKEEKKREIKKVAEKALEKDDKKQETKKKLETTPEKDEKLKSKKNRSRSAPAKVHPEKESKKKETKDATKSHNKHKSKTKKSPQPISSAPVVSEKSKPVQSLASLPKGKKEHPLEHKWIDNWQWHKAGDSGALALEKGQEPSSKSTKDVATSTENKGGVNKKSKSRKKSKKKIKKVSNQYSKPPRPHIETMPKVLVTQTNDGHIHCEMLDTSGRKGPDVNYTLNVQRENDYITIEVCENPKKDDECPL